MENKGSNAENSGLKHSLITNSVAEKTIKALDAYMAILNEKCKTCYNKELYSEILNVAKLTNRWLTIVGEKDKNKYYDL